jgi:hypothetical protein
METRSASGVTLASSHGAAKKRDTFTRKVSPSLPSNGTVKKGRGGLGSYSFGTQSGGASTVSADRSVEKVDLDLDMLNPLSLRHRTGHGPNGMLSADVYCGFPDEGKPAARVSNVSDAHRFMPNLERGRTEAQQHEMANMDKQYDRYESGGMSRTVQNGTFAPSTGEQCDDGVYGIPISQTTTGTQGHFDAREELSADQPVTWVPGTPQSSPEKHEYAVHHMAVSSNGTLATAADSNTRWVIVRDPPSPQLGSAHDTTEVAD